MSRRVINYLQHPSFTETEWQTRNPLLAPGETGYVLVDGEVRRSKVGPGRWNDLPYFNDTFFDNTGVVVNPIGDATGILEGEELMTIINKMLFPYGIPDISALTNNAAGVFNNTSVMEVGSSLTGTVQLKYSISNTNNLVPLPIAVNSSGLFSNDGSFANIGAINMNLAATINPSVATIFPISVKPLHLQGEGTTKQTFISYTPRLIWGVSPLTTITGTQFNSIGQKLTMLSSNFKRDYDFTASGYCWLGIPSMLNPASLIFTDVTDPNAPAGFGMEDKGTLLVNNGVGTYNYQMFRSTYYITETFSRLRVA